MAFEGGGTDVRKNLMKPDTDRIKLAFQIESLRCWSFLRRFSSLSPDMKSIYILYSGSELAISLPSEDRIFPRLGFTVTFSLRSGRLHRASTVARQT